MERPLAALLVRAQLVLGVACTSTPEAGPVPTPPLPAPVASEPVLVPVAAPEPAPDVAPVRAPEPVPAPVPIPEATPQPAPQPAPAPVPQPEPEVIETLPIPVIEPPRTAPTCGPCCHDPRRCDPAFEGIPERR